MLRGRYTIDWPDKPMTLEEVRHIIRANIDQVGGMAELARRLGISQTFLNDKLKGRWGHFMGPKLLDALGLEVRYVSRKKRSKK